MRVLGVAAAVSGSLISTVLLLSCTQPAGGEASATVAVSSVALSLADATRLCAAYPGKRVVVGSDLDDVIDGTSKADCIVAGRGNDRIHAGGGDDVVFAGDGDDVVHGDSGQDTIFGGWGNDKIYGGTGVDELHGEDGADYLDGQSGADRIFGDGCHDRIAPSYDWAAVNGGAGTDACHGVACELPAFAGLCRWNWECGRGMRCVAPSGVCVAAGAERCESESSGGGAGGGCVATATTDATCDGLDDDCNGAIDEEYARQSVSCGVGACMRTQLTSCVGGAVVSQCTPGSPASSDGTCDGVDDNCNGAADDGYTPTATRCGVGRCAASGSMSCVQGAVVDSCVPGSAAADDATCDGVDDDCDGARDEDFVTQVIACGAGACAASGTRSCVAGAIVTSCRPGTGASRDEVCNGIDDDCDGSTDEEYASQSTRCGIGACASIGSTSCLNGTELNSCTPGLGAPTDASCDGIDDDCDGRHDEDYSVVATQCGIGQCTRSGSTRCEQGVVTSVCVPGVAARDDASCNGLDDDCDGNVDDDYVRRTVTCGAGACAATGTTSCSEGNEVASCAPMTPASSDAVCNGLDDNCNGLVDEDYAPVESSCGVGACRATGYTSCAGGVVVDSCRPGTPTLQDDTCNGIDDDCDGALDEDYRGQVTACGIGACASAGATSCAHGVIVDSCVPALAAANDASCNGIDDDCDRSTDEEYVSQTVHCGVGACAAMGTTSCALGQIVSSCTPEAAAASDSVCNGIDDDCNAAVDEDFVSAPTSCGVGVCAASGMTSCVSGTLVDTCVAGAGAPVDATCDGIDDDCSGSADEDYVSVLTRCGTGACAGSGATACVAGAVVDSCVAHEPATQLDATCDGVDDDCDGHTDEEYVAQPTVCGVGACATCGQTRCESGAVVDGCTPGTPAADDVTCDGIDDDCGGADDEDYASIPTSCGVGACATTGATSCNAGHVIDTCTPLSLQGDDSNCDGVDDNCNGQVDEAYAPHCDGGAVSACVNGTILPTSCDDHDACTADGCTNGACVHAVACDDGNPCTVDSCDSGVGCIHTLNAGASCSDGNACTTQDVCTVAGSCQGTAAHVDDVNPCTSDSCDPLLGVLHLVTVGASCEDGDACSVGDLCDAAGVCRGAATRNCDDGLFCNGAEVCDSALGCQAGQPPVPDDLVECTQDSCDEATDSVVHRPLDASCSDGNPCTGIERCDALLGCVSGAAPSVDDGNACTADSCDPLHGAVHVALPEGSSCGTGRICDAATHCGPGVFFTNVTNPASFVFNGNAASINAVPVVVGGSTVLRLANGPSQASSVMLRASVSLVSGGTPQSFSAHLTFQMTNSQGPSDADGPGGDGLAFLIATSSAALGGYGGDLGYAGVSPSVIVEFDTFNNGATDLNSGNHVGLGLNGNTTSLVQAPVATRFNDGQVWHAWIEYNASTHLIEVRAAPSSARPALPTVSATLDLGAQLGRDTAFIGFTAGTGSAMNDMDIRSLVWTTF